jgi:hypothetical protein
VSRVETRSFWARKLGIEFAFSITAVELFYAWVPDQLVKKVAVDEERGIAQTNRPRYRVGVARRLNQHLEVDSSQCCTTTC